MFFIEIQRFSINTESRYCKKTIMRFCMIPIVLVSNYFAEAIHSISTRAPLGSFFTATAERAG